MTGLHRATAGANSFDRTRLTSEVGRHLDFDETVLRARCDAARRRALCSPELKWRGYSKMRRSWSLVPDPPNQNDPIMDILHRAGLGSAPQPRRKSGPPRREDRDPVLGMIDEMDARAALLARDDVKPSQYPGLTPEAKASDDQGWIAWFILGDVRTVHSYARTEKLEHVAAIGRSVERTAELARGFIRGLQGKLDTYSARRVERAIGEVLAGKGNGGADYPHQDPSEPERELVNSLLDIRSPWSEPKAPPSIARQLTDELRKRGHTPSFILRALIDDGWEAEPEAAELRREVEAEEAAKAAAEAERGRNTAPGPGLGEPTPPGFMPVGDVLKRAGIRELDHEAARKCLERAALKPTWSGKLRIKVPNPVRGGPKFLYHCDLGIGILRENGYVG